MPGQIQHILWEVQFRCAMTKINTKNHKKQKNQKPCYGEGPGLLSYTLKGARASEDHFPCQSHL